MILGAAIFIVTIIALAIDAALTRRYENKSPDDYRQ